MHVTIGDRAEVNNRENELFNWCNRRWPEIYRYIYYRVQNREEAEDLTQETFARAFNRFSFRKRSLPEPGYLKTVALNLIRDRWRRQRVRGTQVPLEESLLEGSGEEEPAIGRARVLELLTELSDEYRRVLQLRIVEGYSRAETARLMGKSEDAVRGLQYRALQTLRKLLTDQLEEAGKS